MTNTIVKTLISLWPLALLAAIFFALWLGFRGKYRDYAKGLLLSLVTVAEQKYGGGTGKLKFAYVSERLYAVMPKAFRLLFTVETVDGWIEEAVARMKACLAKGDGEQSGG